MKNEANFHGLAPSFDCHTSNKPLLVFFFCILKCRRENILRQFCYYNYCNSHAFGLFVWKSLEELLNLIDQWMDNGNAMKSSWKNSKVALMMIEYWSVSQLKLIVLALPYTVSYIHRPKQERVVDGMFVVFGLHLLHTTMNRFRNTLFRHLMQKYLLYSQIQRLATDLFFAWHWSSRSFGLTNITTSSWNRVILQE